MDRRKFFTLSGIVVVLFASPRKARPVTLGPSPLPQAFANVTLDGSGNGVAQLGPTRVREHWQPKFASVKVATNVNEATCTVYYGNTISSATFVDASITGSTGDICGFGDVDLQPGMFVFAQWIGGDPGAIATVAVQGTYTIGAPQ